MRRTIARRSFCAGTMSLALAQHGIAGSAPGGEQLKALAYNVYGGRGWPHQRQRAQQLVKEGRFARELAAALAVHKPDVICLSESPPESVTRDLAQRLKMHHVRFPSAGNWPGTLLSRHPVKAAQNVPLQGQRPKDLFTRHWGKAVIEWPPGKELVIHSVHLYPTPDATVRLREIDAILQVTRHDIELNRSLVVMGDFNHGPESAEYRKWQAAGFVDAFAKAGRGPGETFRSDIPKWRIDFVLAHGPISRQIAECRCLRTAPFRLDINDPRAISLSDHLPVLAVFAAPTG